MVAGSIPGFFYCLEVDYDYFQALEQSFNVKSGEHGRYVVSPSGKGIPIGFSGRDVCIELKSDPFDDKYLALADLEKLIQWHLSHPGVQVTSMIGYDHPDVAEMEELLGGL